MTATYGFDTETPGGRLALVATDKEAADVVEFNDAAAFLTQHKYSGSILFSFNLRFDIEALLALIHDRAVLEDLYFNLHTVYDRYKIQWIPRKKFTIGRDRHTTRIYDIAQFFSPLTLEKAASIYLNEHKFTNIDNARIGKDVSYYKDNYEEIKQYCIHDAYLAKRLSDVMRDLIESTDVPEGRMSFRNPVSEAKISEMYIRDHYKYPKILPSIELYHYAAEQAYHGGIFSTLQRGYFNQPLYLYDINSAYPSVMGKLPHWANGRFERLTHPDSDENDTEYGWYLCTFDCPHIPYPDFTVPYVFDFCVNNRCDEVLLNPKRIVYPCGERRQWLTKLEYDWLIQRGYEVEWHGGVDWIQRRDEYKSPFSWVPAVYELKERLKREGDARVKAAKYLLNAAYGKTAQARHGRGTLTNFFYASYITAATRLKLTDAYLSSPDAVLELATDSLLSTQPLNLPISRKLGDWGCEEYACGLLIGSGIKQLWSSNLDNNGNREFTTHARGLTDRRDFNLFEVINNARDKDKVYYVRERPLHLGEILTHTKLLNLSQLGVFTEIKKSLNVNTDKKRRWERDYTSFGDLLDSEPQGSRPWSLSEILKMVLVR